MYNGTAGSMYEEIEEARRKKIRKRKIMRRRIIAIILLVILVGYLLILLNDIRRFYVGEHPLITISQQTKEYDDGKVETYYSIGWLFRYYSRETIRKNEIEPFWAKIKMDNILNRNVNDPDLPEIEKDYTVPENITKKNKVKDVLFFYDKDEKLLGTYKCILSETNCEMSKSAYLDEDKKSRNNTTPMAIIDNRYVFITEYKNKNSEAEEQHIYLYDITANHIIAQYEDVRYTTIVKDEDNNEYGAIDSSKYIIKKNGLWGIDEVIKGQVSNFEDYKYEYITYDEDTKLYIFKDSTNQWVIMNSDTRNYSKPIKETIDKLYYINDKIYIIAYVTNETNFKKNYLLYNQEAVNVLSKENIDDLVAYEKFLAYTNDSTLYIIDYDGNEIISSIPLSFTSATKYQSKVNPFTIKILGDTLIISTPKDQTLTHMTTEYYYNIGDWSLIRTRDNVKETTE